MARIAVVTDSTVDLAPEELSALDVVMVPLKVHFGEDTYRDWLDLSVEEFYAKLTAADPDDLPKTSQPTPGEFSAAFQALADDGAEGIVSLHISSKLSGTYESAVLAAKDAPVPVRVVDTLMVAGAMQLSLRAACAARDAGAGLDDVEKAARETAAATELFFLLDTIDFLVKGGRAGRSAGLAAAMLNIKPVLQVRDGLIEPFKKVKGTRRAIVETAETVAERTKTLGPVDVVIINALAPDLAKDLEAALVAAGADMASVSHSDIGAVIGTHVGPGALGVGYAPVR